MSLTWLTITSEKMVAFGKLKYTIIKIGDGFLIKFGLDTKKVKTQTEAINFCNKMER